MRHLVLVSFVLWPFSANAQDSGVPAQERFQHGQTQAPPNDAELLRRLRVTCTSKAESTPLHKWLGSLVEQHGIRISVNTPELGLKGVDPNIPITINFENVSVATQLDRVLKPLHLEYIVRNGVLEVTSATDALSYSYRRVYCISPTAMPYSAGDIAELFSKSAEHIQETTGESSVVQLLTIRGEESQTLQLYVLGNKAMHGEIQAILELFLPGDSHPPTKIPEEPPR